MDATEVVGRLPGILGSLEAQGFDTRPLVIESPASPGQVDAVEGQLGASCQRRCGTA